MNKISKVLVLGMRMCYNHLFGRAIKELWPTVLHCYTVLRLFFLFSATGFRARLPSAPTSSLSGQLEAVLNLLFAWTGSLFLAVTWSPFWPFSHLSSSSIVLQGALWFFEKPFVLAQDLVPTVCFLTLVFLTWTPEPNTGFFWGSQGGEVSKESPALGGITILDLKLYHKAVIIR